MAHRFSKHDVEYHVPGRKRPVSCSTRATSDFLAIVHEDHPGATIEELRDMISDRSQFIPEPEALKVLDDHIKAGYGSNIPNWRY